MGSDIGVCGLECQVQVPHSACCFFFYNHVTPPCYMATKYGCYRFNSRVVMPAL